MSSSPKSMIALRACVRFAVPTRCRIAAASEQPRADRLFYRRPQVLMSVLFDQAYHLNHLTGATLFSVPANQLFQQPIVTLWPQSFFPPRRERLGAGQRSRLALQHIQ